MIPMTLDDIIRNTKFELEVNYDGATAAPVAALGQLNEWDQTYTGNPLLACSDALFELEQELRDWEPSKSAFIPQYGTLARFAKQGQHNWFREGFDLGLFRVATFMWAVTGARNLRACTETPADFQVKHAKKLLTDWSQIISDVRNEGTLQ